MSDSEAPQYKVFVGGLTWDLTNDDLVSGEAGKALEASLWRCVLTNRHTHLTLTDAGRCVLPWLSCRVQGLQCQQG